MYKKSPAGSRALELLELDGWSTLAGRDPAALGGFLQSPRLAGGNRRLPGAQDNLAVVGQITRDFTFTFAVRGFLFRGGVVLGSGLCRRNLRRGRGRAVGAADNVARQLVEVDCGVHQTEGEGGRVRPVVAQLDRVTVGTNGDLAVLTEEAPHLLGVDRDVEVTFLGDSAGFRSNDLHRPDAGHRHRGECHRRGGDGLDRGPDRAGSERGLEPQVLVGERLHRGRVGVGGRLGGAPHSAGGGGGLLVGLVAPLGGDGRGGRRDGCRRGGAGRGLGLGVGAQGDGSDERRAELLDQVHGGLLLGWTGLIERRVFGGVNLHQPSGYSIHEM